MNNFFVSKPLYQGGGGLDPSRPPRYFGLPNSASWQATITTKQTLSSTI
jgi:hypothetical protein